MYINDVIQHLHNQAIGVSASTLFRGYLPESPDAAIAVLDTGGVAGDHYVPTKNPTFQVMIRSVDYDTGRAKLDAVITALDQKKMQTLVPNGTFFMSIYALTPGGHLGRDENDRDLFSVNFICLTR